MAITYDVPTNTITVTGYSELTPCTFLDIYNASVAGGWGVVSKQGNNQFKIDTFIHMGNGTTPTYFKDTSKMVEIEKTCYMFKELHFQLGTVLDETLKIVDDGCYITFIDGGFYGSSTYKVNYPIYFYDSVVICADYREGFAWWSSGGRCWGCILKMYPGNVIAPAVVDMVNTLTRNTNYGNSRCPVSADNWQIINPATYGLYFGGNDLATLWNVRIVNASVDVRTRAFHGTVKMINCECGWVVSHYRTGSGRTYRQYTFNKRVIDELGNPYVGKSWILKDQFGTTQHSGVTQADGKLATIDIIVSMRYYVKGTSDIIYAPYTLWIDGETDYLDYDSLDLPMEAKDVSGSITMVRVSDIVNAVNSIPAGVWNKALDDHQARGTMGANQQHGVTSLNE